MEELTAHRQSGRDIQAFRRARDSYKSMTAQCNPFPCMLRVSSSMPFARREERVRVSYYGYSGALVTKKLSHDSQCYIISLVCLWEIRNAAEKFPKESGWVWFPSSGSDVCRLASRMLTNKSISSLNMISDLVRLSWLRPLWCNVTEGLFIKCTNFTDIDSISKLNRELAVQPLKQIFIKRMNTIRLIHPQVVYRVFFTISAM